MSGAREDWPGGDHGEGSHGGGGKARQSSPGKIMWLVGDGFGSAMGCVEVGAGAASMEVARPEEEEEARDLVGVFCCVGGKR